MTFDTMSHAAYDVATTMGSVTTPKGGFRPIGIDLTNRKFSGIAHSVPRPKLSASTQISGKSHSLAMHNESASWSEIARKKMLASTIADSCIAPKLSLRNHRASVYDNDRHATTSVDQ